MEKDKKTTIRFHAIYPKYNGYIFTLTEILIVIAIIAVLVAMLAPALGKAIGVSYQVSCLNNERQLMVSYCIYSNEFNDLVPLQWHGQEKQFNYGIWTKDSDQYYNLGILYAAGIIPDDGGILYCPANKGNINVHGCSANPWPPGDGNYHCRANYSIRPMQQFINGKTTGQWANWTQFSKKCIAADLVSKSSYLDEFHISGVNLSYGDGSSKWEGLKLLLKTVSPSFWHIFQFI